MFTSSPISLVLFIVIHSNSNSHSNLAFFQQVPFPLPFGFQTISAQMVSPQNQFFAFLHSNCIQLMNFAVSGCNTVLLIW